MKTPNAVSSPPNPSRPRFAIPARLHLVIVFMAQVIVLLLVGGIAAPSLYEQHVVATWALVVGAIVVGGGAVAAIAEAARLIPVRCKSCRQRARFLGAAWWPFIYRYACFNCGHAVRYEVGGR